MKETKERVYYDLTYPQRSIITTEQYYENPHISAISGYTVYKSTVDIGLLKKAIEVFLSNHDAYNIKFSKVNNEIKQYIDTQAKPEVKHSKFANIEAVKEFISSVSFTLLDSQLYYFTTFETDNNEFGYAVSTHHAITDAWSQTLMVTQINLIYDELLHGKAADNFPKSSFFEAIDQENHYLFSKKFIKDKMFWENEYNEQLELPEIRDNHKFDSKAKRVSFKIDKKYFDFCTNNKITPFSFFLSSLFIYFSRIFNNKNIIIGTPVLNRTNYQEKNVLGMFISTQGFKQFVDDEITAKSFLQNINSTQFSLLRHQKYPFELIQKYYGENYDRKQNLYDILFSYQNARAISNDELPFDYESEWTFSGAQADALAVSVYDIDNSGDLQIGYDYIETIYSEKEINEIHSRLFHILDQIIDNININLKDIEIITESEKEKLVFDFNKTFEKYDTSLTISKLFEKVAKDYPDQTALIFDDKSVTYNELNRKANYLANILRNNGVKNNDIVGILSYRSFEMIVCQLAILKCGGAYLPIDPAYPEERISYILKDSRCPLLLVTPQVQTEKYDISTLIVNYDELKEKKDNITNISKPNDLAYIIYTSGSTGKPKGVMVEQSSIVNTLLWRKEYYNFDTSFITLQVPSFAFDSSVEDIFTSLISGGTLVLLKQNNTNFNLPLISTLIKKYKINHMLVVPSFYNIMLSELSEDLKKAKIFTIAGEGFSKELVKKHFELLPNVRLVNEYGPTENSVCSTFYEFDKDHTDIYIGKPVTNCACYVLNNNLQLQPYNVKGELYVSGVGLARGYIGKDDLTEERFIKNPYYKKDYSCQKMYKTGDLVIQTETGNLIFCERVDFQIKHNGYRINLGEIDAVLSKITNNPNVITILKKSNNKSILVSFIETKNKIDDHAIKKELTKLLPHYMVPGEVHALERFPVTPNNKIDRKALEQLNLMDHNRIIASPRNYLDKTILDIWKKVLNTDDISIEDSIFDIGGDSLSLISIQSMLYKMNIHTKVQDLFEYPTIKELSDHLTESTIKQNDDKTSRIYPRIYKDDINDIKKSDAKFPKGILLTGSTGFLGAHILNELLSKPEVEKVYCIIREKPDKTSEQRICEKLDFYFDGKWKDQIGKRLIILKGDLSRENFGLNPSSYKELMVKADTIINCASLVKHFGVYDLFYNANVLSVKHLVDFAKTALCSINHISTTSVSGNYLIQNTIQADFTENDFYIGQNYEDNVYIHSKFEAENILFKAQQEGVNVNIFRIGNIMPRVSDGKFQVNKYDNAYYKRMFGFVTLGILPENLKTLQLEFTPVDECSKAIVSLCTYKNKVFHLQNDNLVSISDFIKALNKIDKTIQFVSQSEFNKSIKNDSDNEILESFITDLDYKDVLDYTSNITVLDNITLKYLSLIDFKWSKISEEYLERFINDLIK